MGKLSCQSGLTFKIYFQILLLSLRSPGTDVFRIWLPLYLPLGTNVMCLYFLCLVWVYLPFGCQFQVTITKYRVLQVCKKSKIKYFILKWNKHRQKVSLNMLYYQEMAQRAIEFSKLCKFDPFCSIPRARLAISWKYDMFEDTFLDFSRLIY